MSRDYFYTEELKLRDRIVLLIDLISEENVHNVPCPLLTTQLNELDALCGRLHSSVRKMIQVVNDVMGEA